MIVVAILGALAAIAIPAFSTYLRRSRAAEATELLKSIFTLAAAYYQPERGLAGINGSLRNACVVDTADNGVVPSPTKQAGNYADPAWEALDFAMGYSYFRFEVETVGGPRCGVPHSTTPLYYFRARGDLDGDGLMSMYELAAGSDRHNFLYHSRGFYVADGLE